MTRVDNQALGGHNFSMSIKSPSGQILVLVLLVVLVGMTIGLSVAARTLTTVRNQGELTESNRAFSAAEAGIEKALAQIKAGKDCSGDACNPEIVGAETNVEVLQIGNSPRALGVSSLSLDDVLQVNLKGFKGYVTLYWGSRGDSANCSTAPAIVVTAIYEKGGEYGISKGAYDGCQGSSGDRVSNGFKTSVIPSDPTNQVTLQDGSKKSDYGFKYDLIVNDGPGPLVKADENVIALRVKVMYAGDVPVAVQPAGGASLPEQGQQITSTSVVGGQQRTVKVLKTSDALPAIFDYALFNGSTSALSKPAS